MQLPTGETHTYVCRGPPDWRGRATARRKQWVDSNDGSRFWPGLQEFQQREAAGGVFWSGGVSGDSGTNEVLALPHKLRRRISFLKLELTMKTWLAVSSIAAIPLVACSSAQSDWQQASASNTVAAYQNFSQAHPNTARAVEARNRIRALEEARAWARALQANTVAAFDAYMQEQPAGIHVEQAQDRIAASERMSAWTAAAATDTPEALEAFLEKYPQGPEADQARAKLTQLTGYRVQFSAYRSQTQAEKIRDRLQGKYGDLLGNVVVVPATGSNSHVVRSAPMGEVEANSACAKLKKAHQTCAVIKDANS